MSEFGHMQCQNCGFKRDYIIGGDPFTISGEKAEIAAYPAGHWNISTDQRIIATPVFCQDCDDITYTNINHATLTCIQCSSQNIANLKSESELDQGLTPITVISQSWNFEPIQNFQSSLFMCPKCRDFSLRFIALEKLSAT